MKKPPLKIAKESVMKNNLSTSASNLTSPPGHNPKTGSNLTSHIASPLNNSYYQEFRSKITPSSYPPQNPSRMHEFNR